MRAVVLLLGVAACGGSAAGTDGGSSPDATIPCGADLCAAVGADCGMAVDSCGGEVDCGTCNFATEMIGEVGILPAIDAGDKLRVAYVETSGGYEVMLAERGPAGWQSEPVAPLGGPPLGPVDLVVAPDGMRWIAFVDDAAQVRVASAPKGGAWTVSDPLGSGAAVALGLDGGGQPVLALTGLVGATTGVFVETFDADQGWVPTPVGDPTASGVPHGLAMAVQGQQISLAWRDPGDEALRFATGKGTAFTLEIVDPVVPAPRDDRALSLAFDPAGRPHVLYGRDGMAIAAVRAGEVWHTTPLPFDGGDGDDALAIGFDGVVRGALFDTGGLRALDGIGGVFLSQPVTTACTDGTVDLAIAPDGAVHVVSACAEGIEVRQRVGPTPP